MIIIEVLNAEEVVTLHAGKMPLNIARVLRVDLKKRIEKSMAKRMAKEMKQNGLKVEIRVE